MECWQKVEYINWQILIWQLLVCDCRAKHFFSVRLTRVLVFHAAHSGIELAVRAVILYQKHSDHQFVGKILQCVILQQQHNSASQKIGSSPHALLLTIHLALSRGCSPVDGSQDNIRSSLHTASM